MLDTRVGFRTHVYDFCRELGLSIDIVHGRGMDRAVDPRRPLGGCAGRRATDLIGALPGSRQSQSAHHPRQIRASVAAPNAADPVNRICVNV